MDPPCSDEEQVKGKSLQTRRLDAPATLLGTNFRDSFAILSRVRRTEIHAGREVALHGLAAAHGTGIRALHVKFVPEICELVLRGTGEAIFDKHIAAGEGVFRKARCLERGLNVHFEIDDIGDELRVGLRLIPAAHDSEGDAHIAVLGESRNDGMEWTFMAAQSIG